MGSLSIVNSLLDKSTSSDTPKADAPVLFPGGWTSWDPENETAAKLWLSLPCNSDFSHWDSAPAEKVEYWLGLESRIKDISSLKPYRLMNASREACVDVWASKKSTKSHAKPEDLKSIGKKTAASVMSMSTAVWKEEASTWMRKAFISIAGRHLALWKKSLRKDKEGTKKEEDDDDDDDDAAKSVTSTSTAAQSKGSAATTAAGTKSNTSDGTSVPAKRRRTARGAKKVSFEVDNQSLSHRPRALQSTQQRPLVFRNIAVSLDEGIADGESAPYHAVVGVAAIIDDRALHREHEDIRCSHLSYDKFVRVLRSIHEVYDLSRLASRRLVYDLPVAGSERKETEIRSEADFQYAIGVLDWNMKDNSSREHLLMRLLALPYRY
jgi:hypothetical protein